MSAVRPADYPPPFSTAEVIGAPTDPADERIEVGVLVVGGGPGGLACAIRIGQLARGAARPARAARRRAGGGAGEGQAARLAPPLGRGRQPARAAAPVQGAPLARGDPQLRAGRGRGRVPAHGWRRAAHPAAADDDEPRQLGVLAVAARPVPGGAGRGGRGDDPPRDRRREAAARARTRRGRPHRGQGTRQGGRAARELRARCGHHRAGRPCWRRAPPATSRARRSTTSASRAATRRSGRSG